MAKTDVNIDIKEDLFDKALKDLTQEGIKKAIDAYAGSPRQLIFLAKWWVSKGVNLTAYEKLMAF